MVGNRVQKGKKDTKNEEYTRAAVTDGGYGTGRWSQFFRCSEEGEGMLPSPVHAGEKGTMSRYPMRQSEGAVYTVKVTDIQSGA